MRGGEKVLLELVRLLPQADVFTLLWNRGTVSPEIERRVRATSFLQRLPRAATAYRNYLPLFPAAIRSLDLTGYDLVLSSSHAVAHAARVPSGARHISYLHTPMRYLWDARADYFRFGRGRWWKRAALAAVSPWLRRFDRRAATRVDTFVANSRHVRDRIRRIYDRDAEVIYPPVDTDFFTPGAAPDDYYLVVSSLEPYKRIDLAVDAFSGGHRRLLIAGSGTLDRQLRARARPPVEFLGWVSDEKLCDLYRRARALLFPGREDFGMVPVEAQACGRPVICYAAGGALESVVAGQTGVYFQAQTISALLDAVQRAESINWDTDAIRQNSLSFSRSHFQVKMRALLG